MSAYHNFIYEDRDLYDVMANSTYEELNWMAELMCTKMTCSLEPKCRDVAAIVNEFQRFGGNTIANIKRGHGVSYREIVQDVANKIGVAVEKMERIEQMEWRIFDHLIDRVVEKMDEKTKQEFREELRNQAGRQTIEDIKTLMKNPAVSVVIIGIIVRQLLLKLGIQSAAKLATGRLVAILAGPIGLVIAGIWTIIDIAGPAYTVTVPGVLLVSLIRTRLRADEAAKEIGG